MTRQWLLHLFHIQQILSCELLLRKVALLIMNVGFIRVLTPVLGTMCEELDPVCFKLPACGRNMDTVSFTCTFYKL